MYTANKQWIVENQILKVTIKKQDRVMTFKNVIDSWQSDSGFVLFFCDLLVQLPWQSYRWETPPINIDQIGREFEFVVIDSPELVKPADGRSFRQHFTTEEPTVVFPNLGGDAILVVPNPVSDSSVYAHLASFLRGADQFQIHHFWKRVGQSIEAHLRQQMLWLNTAGAGVPWVHVRLDSRPKYYRHGPYREIKN